ncbi:alpha-amylase [Desulfurococcus mucosus]|uniref:Alpha amylase n=1 Tax=Desulfurococcus mucosus (strain ATCC 35584 / DSM 2162 / JCM 9187 / O7/1) TaxID=765177 RepID=E8R984_DESM0|nr:alpha-amylase [Desulfurococcus mucosus]ADV65060.1 alpha amylase [Desulfurococcus mucosus DSM 2162]
MERIIGYLEENYLPQARWWPWKGTKRSLELLGHSGDGEITILLFRSNNLVFHLPLARVTEVPANLKTRGFCIGNECYVEAEYLPKYIESLSKIEGITVEYLQETSELTEVLHAEPLTLESTNTVALYETKSGSRLVLKSYRLIPMVNMEALMLRRLAEEKYRHIPEILAFIRYRDTVTGVVSRFVRGVGDGGYPFYKSLLKSLSGEGSCLRIGLASKLGIIISGLHRALNSERGDFFGAEPISDGDVEKWRARLERMYSSSLKRLDELVSSERDNVGNEAAYWRDMLEKTRGIVEDAASMLDEYVGLMKARTHQDLHLAQMIYVESPAEDFIITDFEGEPGRSIDERLWKEPPIRDLASMIRSFHYLSHAAIMSRAGRSQGEVSKVMISNDPSAAWRLTHVKAMVYSYLMDVDPRLLGVERNTLLTGFRRLLYPWIVERAIYETYYESLYRPSWVSIPIAGLFEAYRVYRGGGAL